MTAPTPNPRRGRPDGPVVVVVGGGITGLAAAHRLVTAGPPGLTVALLDADRRLGGKIRTTPFGRPSDGLAVDEGADAFLARVPWATDLAHDLGLGDTLVAPATGRAWVWSRGRLRPLPEGLVLGVPSSVGTVARSGIISVPGLARAGADLVLPRRRHDGSVAGLVRDRLGREVDERLVEPLLGGIHAGRTAGLDLASVAPQIHAVAARHRSLVLGLRAERREHPVDPTAPVFLAPRDGMAALVDRLAEVLAASGRCTVETGQRVVALHRQTAPAPDRSGPLELEVEASEPTVGGSPAWSCAADAVVLAVPSPAAAAMVDADAPATASLLRRIPWAGVVLTTLAFPVDAVPAPLDGRGLLDGSGLLVPVPEGRLVTAVSWASSKWAHLARPGRVLLRVSAGRDGDDRALGLDDDGVVAAMLSDLADIMGVRGSPDEVRVSRWPDSFPQYRPGHGDLVSRIDAEAARELPGVRLAGASYRGVGVPACIRQGQEAADAVLDRLHRVDEVVVRPPAAEPGVRPHT